MERSQLTFPMSEQPSGNGAQPPARAAAIVPATVTGRPVAPADAGAPAEPVPPASPAPARKATSARKATGPRKKSARKSSASRKTTTRRPSVPPMPAWERFVVSAGSMAVRLVAAVVSYEHMRFLATEAGEGWRAWLWPISVDGLAVVALVTIRRNRLAGQRPDRMAWLALGLALAVSLAANVAAAPPTFAGRAVAAWPPAALLLAEVIHKHRGSAGANRPAPVPSNPRSGGGA